MGECFLGWSSRMDVGTKEKLKIKFYGRRVV
jgi:hypothetical protein